MLKNSMQLKRDSNFATRKVTTKLSQPQSRPDKIVSFCTYLDSVVDENGAEAPTKPSSGFAGAVSWSRSDKRCVLQPLDLFTLPAPPAVLFEPKLIFDCVLASNLKVSDNIRAGKDLELLRTLSNCRWKRELQVGANFVSYNPATGLPSPCFMICEQDSLYLYNSLAEYEASRTSSVFSNITSAFGAGASPRVYSVLDISVIYFGPYFKPNYFRRYLDKLDQATGLPWQCFTIEFTSGKDKVEVLNLVGADWRQVARWIVSLQAVAPLCFSACSYGRLFWNRLIFALNMWGLDERKWPGNKSKENAMSPASPTTLSSSTPSSKIVWTHEL